MEAISAYEQQRAENIKRNEAALAALGLLGDNSLRPKVVLSEEEKESRRKQRQKNLDAAMAARRASSRSMRSAAIEQPRASRARSALIFDNAISSIEAECELLRAQQRPIPAKLQADLIKAKAAARPAPTPVKRFVIDDDDEDEPRRKPVKKAAKAVALSDEERRALADAKDWLEHMAAYFRAKLSEPNLNNVMKVVSKLASGAGVPHPLHSRFFMKGKPVTLDMDLVKLKDEANEFLRPEDDSGHGWRLNHPIGKLIIFQAYLASQRRAPASPKAKATPTKDGLAAGAGAGKKAAGKKRAADLDLAEPESPPPKRAGSRAGRRVPL